MAAVGLMQRHRGHPRHVVDLWRCMRTGHGQGQAHPASPQAHHVDAVDDGRVRRGKELRLYSGTSARRRPKLGAGRHLAAPGDDAHGTDFRVRGGQMTAILI